MTTSVNSTANGATDGSGHPVNGSGQTINAGGSNKDGPPVNTPHPLLTGLGMCHKFPYHCVCCQHNYLMSVSVSTPLAIKEHMDILIAGSCSGGADNCCRLDQRASKGDTNISNNTENKIYSHVPASSCAARIRLRDVLSFLISFYEYESRTDKHESDPARSSGCISLRNLETGNNSHEREQLNDIANEIVQSISFVPTGVIQRSVSAEHSTHEAHRCQTHKPIHQNNKYLTSSSLPSYSSSLVFTSSESLETQHNQHSFEKQISDNRNERDSLDSVNAQEIISPSHEKSDFETSFSRNNYSLVSSSSSSALLISH